jgi:hypothetical protein
MVEKDTTKAFKVTVALAMVLGVWGFIALTIAASRTDGWADVWGFTGCGMMAVAALLGVIAAVFLEADADW